MSHVHMHVHACMSMYGILRHISSANFAKLLLRLFWDRSRAVVAIYMVCRVLHPVLTVTLIHAWTFAKPTDVKFP